MERRFSLLYRGHTLQYVVSIGCTTLLALAIGVIACFFLRTWPERSLLCSIPYIMRLPRERRGRGAVLKQVIAIVKPYLAEKVLEGLKRAPIEACDVREVKGYGRQKSYLDEYVGSEYSLAFLPKVEITLWVDDARVEEIVRRVVEAARTGRMGDGKIFVLPASEGQRTIDI